MAFCVNMGPWGSVFAVPSRVVDEHIRMCGAASLKALLILLRNQERAVEIDELASIIGLSHADTRDAVNYWISAGIISDSEAPDMCVKSDNITPAREQPATAVRADEKHMDGVRITTISSRPKLTSSEISDMAKNDKNVRFLLEEAERILCSLLSRTETETIVSLYTYNGIPADVLLMVLSYCVSTGKANMNYFAKTACNWLEQGVDTHEKAEEHIKRLTERKSNEGAVMSAFGIRERKLSKKEQGYIDKWCGEYGFDIAMIRLAYERTVDSIGEISFPYTDKILSTWRQKGFTTPRQAAEEKKEDAPKTAKQGGPAPSYDMDRWKNSVLYGPVKD